MAMTQLQVSVPQWLGQQLLGIGRVGCRDGHADAGGDADDLTAEVERALGGGDRPGCHVGGDGLGPAGVGAEPGEHDHELVAADAGHEVVGAELVGDAAGGLLEEVVAVGVAERVVDPLEAVEVHEQQTQVVTGA